MAGVRSGDCFPTPAERLFLRAALLPGAAGLTAWRTLRPSFDLDRIGGVMHTLVPLLYVNLQALGVDDSQMALLKGQYRFFWLRNQLQMARGAKAIDALQRAGIPVAVLKGAAMAAAYLTDPTVRPMSDIDVLVPTNRLPAALGALRGAGWAPQPNLSDRMIVDDVTGWSPSWDFRDANATSVDLHWHVMHLSLQPDADDDFWAASEPAMFTGRTVRTLCAADHVLHSLSHGMSWQEGAIRWVPDSILILRRAGEAFDWSRLIAQAKKRRLLEYVRAGVDYLQREFTAPVPVAVAQELRRSRSVWFDRVEFRARARRSSDNDWTGRIAHAVAMARRRRPLAAATSLRADLRRLGAAYGLPEDVGLSTVLIALATGRSWRLRRGLRRLGRGGAIRAAEARRAPVVGAGDSLYLGRHVMGNMEALFGWHFAEPNGRWTNGRQAALTVLWNEPTVPPRALEFEAWPLICKHRTEGWIDVVVNGVPAGRRRARMDHRLQRPWRVDLSTIDLRGCGPIEIVLTVDRAARPCDLYNSGDARLLGCFVHRIGFVAASFPDQQASATPRPSGLRAIPEIVDPPSRDLPPLELAPGGEFVFGIHGGIPDIPGTGWRSVEPRARWSGQEDAQVRFRWTGPADAPIALEVVGQPLLYGARRSAEVAISVNGRRIAARHYVEGEDPMAPWRIDVPAGTAGADGALDLTIAVKDPTSPMALGMSADKRILGYYLHRIGSPAAPRV